MPNEAAKKEAIYKIEPKRTAFENNWLDQIKNLASVTLDEYPLSSHDSILIGS